MYQHSARIGQLDFTKANTFNSIHYKLIIQVSVVNSFLQ